MFTVQPLWSCQFQEKDMSVWLQTKGEFFWVFVKSETNELELYKVMGETQMMSARDGEAPGWVGRINLVIIWLVGVLGWSCCIADLEESAVFSCFDVKPVPIKMNSFSTYQQRAGLYIKERLVVAALLNDRIRNHCMFAVGRRQTSSLRISCTSTGHQTTVNFKRRNSTCGDARPGQNASKTCWTHRLTDWLSVTWLAELILKFMLRPSKPECSAHKHTGQGREVILTLGMAGSGAMATGAILSCNVSPNIFRYD